MKVHGVDFYYNWCKSHNYIPIACKVMGSHMFGTNTPMTRDIDLYGVHVQPPKDFMSINPVPLTHQFDIGYNGINLEYKSMDILHFARMIAKGSINEIIWLFKEPNLGLHDRIYNDTLYTWELKLWLRHHLPQDFGKSFFGMMEGNYQKYIVKYNEKDHKLYKKFLHIFCAGWSYYRILCKLAHTKSGYYYTRDIDFKLPLLVSRTNCLLNLIDHKARDMPLDNYELGYYKLKYEDFVEWLQKHEAKYLPKITFLDTPMSDELLTQVRLGLFDKE